MVMQLPQALINALTSISAFDAEAFVAAHNSYEPTVSIRLNPQKPASLHPLVPAGQVPWAEQGRYLDQRPQFTLHPLLHAGAYYVQEPSSMFLEQFFKQHVNLNSPLTVLDLCAAPGGKSTHIQSLLSADSVLVSNEVIKTRVPVLMENLTKWGARNALVTNNDAADFGKLPHLFDAVVVDAPCSGSGLFRKDANAINEWSEAAVEMCSQRQQRILADVWPALKPGGLLLYATCSYSPAENETIADWLVHHLGAHTLAVQVPDTWGIVETASPLSGAPGYRFFPHLTQGEGFFVAAFRKPDSENNSTGFQPKIPAYKPHKTQIEACKPWMDIGADCLYQHEQQLFVMPEHSHRLFLALKTPLNIRKAGVKLGDLAHGHLLPDHALALSNRCLPQVQRVELPAELALQYLRKAPVDVPSIQKGWQLVTHQHLPLGWIKNLGNRINNYYPADWRIRMA